MIIDMKIEPQNKSRRDDMIIKMIIYLRNFSATEFYFNCPKGLFLQAKSWKKHSVLSVKLCPKMAKECSGVLLNASRSGTERENVPYIFYAKRRIARFQKHLFGDRMQAFAGRLVKRPYILLNFSGLSGFCIVSNRP